MSGRVKRRLTNGLACAAEYSWRAMDQPKSEMTPLLVVVPGATPAQGKKSKSRAPTCHHARPGGWLSTGRLLGAQPLLPSDPFQQISVDMRSDRLLEGRSDVLVEARAIRDAVARQSLGQLSKSEDIAAVGNAKHRAKARKPAPMIG